MDFPMENFNLGSIDNDFRIITVCLKILTLNKYLYRYWKLSCEFVKAQVLDSISYGSSAFK